MSQIPMTEDARVRALARFGYREQEASFLCRAALHGGYFLRRQYASFVGGKDGGNVTQFVHKALASGHLRSSTWRQGTQLYHLCSRPFYEAIGQGENRNRRPREVLTIKNKLMGLDFVLAHPNVRYLATEQEKLDYFTGALGLDSSCLPSKLYRAAGAGKTTTRYFLDKYPVFTFPAGQAPSPVPAGISFCYVDEGTATLSRFESYLKQYGALLTALPAFCLIYVAAEDTHFKAAQRQFETFLKRVTGPDLTTASFDRILAYFTTRRRYEGGETASFDRAKLIQLRDERREFAGAAWEDLYARWKSGGDRDTLFRLWPQASPRPVCASFSTFLLEHNYDLFGTFLG